MVEGYRLYRIEGLKPPAAVRAATESFRRAMQPLTQFVDDCCVLDPLAWTRSDTLKSAYLAWVEDSGAKPLSTKRFWEELRRLNCTDHQRNDGRGWTGIKLRDSETSA